MQVVHAQTPSVSRRDSADARRFYACAVTGPEHECYHLNTLIDSHNIAVSLAQMLAGFGSIMIRPADVRACLLPIYLDVQETAACTICRNPPVWKITAHHMPACRTPYYVQAPQIMRVKCLDLMH